MKSLDELSGKTHFFCEFKISLLSLALLRASWGQKRHGKSEWRILKMSKEDQKFSGLCIQQFNEWWNDATATFSLLNAIQCWFWNELKRGKERYAAVAIVYWRERSVLSISEKAFKTTKAAHQSTNFSNFQTCAAPTSLLVCLFVLAWNFPNLVQYSLLMCVFQIWHKSRGASENSFHFSEMISMLSCNMDLENANYVYARGRGAS